MKCNLKNHLASYWYTYTSHDLLEHTSTTMHLLILHVKFIEKLRRHFAALKR